MKYSLQISNLSYVVEFGIISYKDLSVVINETPYDYLKVDFVSRKGRGVLVFSDLTNTAKMRIPLETSKFSFLYARTVGAARNLVRKVVSIMRGLYSVPRKFMMRLLPPFAKAQVEVKREKPLDLVKISNCFRNLGYKVVFSDEDRGYELSLYVGKCVAKITVFGKILLFGFVNHMQMYRAITLLKSVCSLSNCEQKALNYLEEYRKVRTDVNFTLLKKRVSLEEISPTQCTVNRLDVTVYEELIAKGANPEVCVLETLLNEKPYALIDGHHRARACQESERTHVDAFVIYPSRAIASKVAEEAILDGVNDIADLKFCD